MNYKKIFILTFNCILLLGNGLENAVIYMSVSPLSSFGHEASGLQLLYPVTVGLIIYLFAWAINVFFIASKSKIWRDLPLYCTCVTCIPIFAHLFGALPLPKSNLFLYYYGIFTGLVLCTATLLLYGRELCFKRKN